MRPHADPMLMALRFVRDRVLHDWADAVVGRKHPEADDRHDGRCSPRPGCRAHDLLQTAMALGLRVTHDRRPMCLVSSRWRPIRQICGTFVPWLRRASRGSARGSRRFGTSLRATARTNLATRLRSVYRADDGAWRFCRHFSRADDGTRTHDLLLANGSWVRPHLMLAHAWFRRF